MAMPNLDEAQIKETAYLYWMEEGQPEGRDQEHWLRAVDALNKSHIKPKPARKAASKTRATKAAPKRSAKPKTKTTQA